MSEQRRKLALDLDDAYERVGYTTLLTLLMEFGLDARLVGWIASMLIRDQLS